MHIQGWESFDGVRQEPICIAQNQLSRRVGKAQQVLHPMHDHSTGPESENSPLVTRHVPFRLSKSFWLLSVPMSHCPGQVQLEMHIFGAKWVLTDSLEAAFSKGRQMAQGCAYFTCVKLKHGFGELSKDKTPQFNSMLTNMILSGNLQYLQRDF